jgi:hypothetical protein
MSRRLLSLTLCVLAVYAIACGPRKDSIDTHAKAFQAGLSKDLPTGLFYEKVEQYLTAHNVPYERDLLDNRIKFTIRREKPWLGGVIRQYMDLNVTIDFDHQGVEKQLRVTAGNKGVRLNLPL